MAKTRSDTERLVLLDSHAILHRAYHAIPDFSSSKGEPTGALYGLVSMLIKLVGDLKPQYVVATRDLAGKTHRHEVYTPYKATRMKADGELIEQLKRAPAVFEAFGIPLYAAQGFEADDILGSIVNDVSSRSDIETVIATGDLDTLQLVSPRTSVYTLKKGINDTILYTEDTVRERFGFGPELMTDYKALRGDPSDNIPGIRGIGEKTAADLITKFGSIDDIYETLVQHPEKFKEAGIRPRMIELLKSGKTDALFSKSLATIRRDAPIDFTLPKMHWHLEDHVPTIIALCDELEFRSLKERVLKIAGAVSKEEEVAEAKAEREVDTREIAELTVALWLLRSDLTNPSLDDVFTFTNTRDVEKAREEIFKMLRGTGKLQEVYDHIEKPLISVIERMNADGVALDVPYLKELSREYTAELGRIATRVYKHAGREFNISSPKQLGVVLYDELALSLPRQKKTATGARTTREEELQKMSSQHPIIADVLAYRELQKLLSTYVDKMVELVGKDGRLHAEFLQAGASTGRMASQNPGLQNIPIRTAYGKRIRNAFIAPRGFALASLDYSQIELRIAAGLSGDEKLIEVFKKGGDIHTAVAARVFNVPEEMVDREMRRRAKVINFGILYGMGVNALRQALGENVTREEAAKYLSEYFANFSGLARYIERTKASAASLGYTETIFGRRRYFPGFKSPLPNIRAQAERMAINAPMQGTQSDIIKLAMVEADRMIEKEEWREKAKLVLQVHDELVYELKKEDATALAQRIRHVMESVAPIEKLSGVPIIADAAIGKNWGEMRRMPHRKAGASEGE